ncbi:hypothetical protein [Streptomyces sp. CAU 1734]|uniref:SCO4225 family membrane protein n=1 Tax=Streptomyces sp. CAU 1734 TaxID=3140360 RepID=UPI00326031C1
MPDASRPRRLPRLRRLLALATDNWLSRGYLALFAVSLPVAFLAPESSYALVHLLLTAPLSTMAMAFPFGAGGGTLTGALTLALSTGWLLLGALVNAAVLGALTDHVRRTARPA